MPLPHPRKILRGITATIALILLAYGLIGTFNPSLIPAQVASLFPSEAFSVSRDNLVMISAFVSIMLGLAFLVKG